MSLPATTLPEIRFEPACRMTVGPDRVPGERLLVGLGDSHLRYLKHAAQTESWTATRFRFCEIPGATGMGLANPRSTTDALREYETFCADIAPDGQTHFLTCLGEVDCGFVIWYRAAKHGMSVDSQFNRSLENYFGFVRKLIDAGHTRVVMMDAPLPTIFDGSHVEHISHERREVKVPLLERTALTRAYNARIAAFCLEHGLDHLPFELDVLDRASGVVRRDLLNADPRDHHLDSAKVAPLLRARLAALGFQ